MISWKTPADQIPPFAAQLPKVFAQAFDKNAWGIHRLAHQNRTIAIASDFIFRVDGAKSPEILEKEGVSASEIATRNRKSLATFHCTPKS